MHPALLIDSLTLTNFRCFEHAVIPLHQSLTVLYAENGGGKTAALNGLAVALGAADSVRRNIGENEVREIVTEPGTLVPCHPCQVRASGSVYGRKLDWERTIDALGGRTTSRGSTQFRNVWRKQSAEPGASWPVIAFYGTQRLSDVARATRTKVPRPGRRGDGYVDALDPRAKDEQFIQWLFDASLARLESGGVPVLEAFLEAIRTAVAHPVGAGEVEVREVLFDMTRKRPVVVLSTGERVPWDRLSDGYHVFLGLVGDLARRCITLNPALGARAVLEAEGVVLIDEVDLSLHPRWQRVVLRHLTQAFPKLQFVVSTHSPQVLSSVQNDQVVGLLPGRVIHPVPVAGRDTNSILRDVFGTTERDEESPQARELRDLYQALDRKDFARADELLRELRKNWGSADPELVRAESHLECARDEKDTEEATAD